MNGKEYLTRILAIAGTLCIWFPVLAPFIFGLASLIESGRFHLDYLMPAELFPAVVAGGSMLLWAAWRSRKYRWLIGAGLAGAVLLLLAGQGVAVLTGLATGEVEPGGWQMALVLACFIAYWLVLAVIGVGGVLLLRHLFRPSPE